MQAATSASNQILPQKSQERNQFVYEKFITWWKDNRATSFSKNVLMAYFGNISNSETFHTMEHIFTGFKSKKAKALNSEQIQAFLNKANDEKYLFTKCFVKMQTDASVSIPMASTAATSSPAPPPSPHTKRKKSYLAEEEDIEVKPSTELIPDEYEHYSDENVLLHVFKTQFDKEDITDDFVKTMQSINYTLNPSHLHYLKNEESLFQDFDSIKKEAANKSALILMFVGFFKEDGSIFIRDDNESQFNIHIKAIWNEFSANNCAELRNKPKIFIFCTSKWQTLTLQSDSKRHHTMYFDKVYEFPAESDLLIIYQKSEDMLQQAKIDFLHQICRNIENFSKKYDIIDLVSHMQKSVPLIISTLTRKFYLTPSNQREDFLSLIENNGSLEDGLKKIKEAVQKLHDTQKKKKKDGKFLNFSFKRKSEDKPKIARKPESVPVKPKEIPSGRLSAASPVPTGRRSRLQSETDSDVRRPSTPGALGTTKKRPMWRN